MVMCYIKNCKSKTEKNSPIRFFSFPKNKTTANEWLLHCRPNTEKRCDARVCSKHFLPTDYLPKTLKQVLMNESPRTVRTLKADAVPSLELEPEILETSVLIPISEYNNLNERIKELEGKLRKHEKLEKKYNKALEKLHCIFSPGQIRCLLNNNRVKWSDEDIAAARSLRTISPEAYRYLRRVVGIPLPDSSTLRRWAAESKNVMPEDDDETYILHVVHENSE